MRIPKDPIKPLEEAIKELLDGRTNSCEYYHSWEYEDNRSKSSALIKKIGDRIGKKLCRRIFSDYLDVEQLEGELQAGLQESCYRLGFSDALVLSRELDQVGKGHLTIFN